MCAREHNHQNFGTGKIFEGVIASIHARQAKIRRRRAKGKSVGLIIGCRELEERSQTDEHGQADSIHALDNKRCLMPVEV
jgi:hypothetical protein